MDYGTVVKDAWRLTLRHRFLWILGIFAGGAVGAWGSPGLRLDLDGSDRGPDLGRLAPMMSDITAWVAQNQLLIGAALIAAVVVCLLLVSVSLVSQGAM